MVLRLVPQIVLRICRIVMSDLAGPDGVPEDLDLEPELGPPT